MARAVDCAVRLTSYALLPLLDRCCSPHLPNKASKLKSKVVPSPARLRRANVTWLHRYIRFRTNYPPSHVAPARQADDTDSTDVRRMIRFRQATAVWQANRHERELCWHSHHVRDTVWTVRQDVARDHPVLNQFFFRYAQAFWGRSLLHHETRTPYLAIQSAREFGAIRETPV
jgi:hypothetical protein